MYGWSWALQQPRSCCRPAPGTRSAVPVRRTGSARRCPRRFRKFRPRSGPRRSSAAGATARITTRRTGARTEAAARGQCGQPVVINRGPSGGVMMYLADSAQLQELYLKGSPSGRNYIGPPGPAGGLQDREIVSFDGRVHASALDRSGSRQPLRHRRLCALWRRRHRAPGGPLGSPSGLGRVTSRPAIPDLFPADLLLRGLFDASFPAVRGKIASSERVRGRCREFRAWRPGPLIPTFSPTCGEKEQRACGQSHLRHGGDLDWGSSRGMGRNFNFNQAVVI